MFEIYVPFNEKESAKSFGAKWNGNSWYIPDEADVSFFIKWIKKEDLESARQLIKEQQSSNFFKLSSLLLRVKKAVDQEMSGVYWVSSEISNIQLSGNNLYLQLSEMNSSGQQVCNNRAVIWKGDVERIQTKFKNATGLDLQKGINVLLKIKVTYSIKYQLSMVVIDVDPVFTLGKIEAKIKRIRDYIQSIGIYNNNKKLKIPCYFKHIAVVSPMDAAGLGDFKSDANLLSECGICEFTYYTAVFQGDKVSVSVSRAINQASFDSTALNFDLIVIIRGGGAKTDLHFLNEFDISKAVCLSLVPVFVGVGHERDLILIDEMAKGSFDTPSKVISFISNNNVNFYNQIQFTSNNFNIKSSALVNKFNSDVTFLNLAAKRCYKTTLAVAKQSLFNTGNSISDLIMKEQTKFRTDINILHVCKKAAIKNKMVYFSGVLIEISNEFERIRVQKVANIKISLDKSFLKLVSRRLFLIEKMKSSVGMLHLKKENGISLLIQNYKSSITMTASKAASLSPLNALKNGYAIIKDEKGVIITTLKTLNKKGSFIILMQDGEKEINIKK